MIKKWLKKYKKEFDNCIEDFKNIKTVYRQIPNILTFMRLVFALPAGIIYYTNPVLSVCLISFLWLTDAVDGKIARKWKLQSKLGADMDTVADKFMFLASAIPLLTSFPIFALNFVFEGIISYINVVGRMKDLNTKTVKSGKVKTVSLVIMLIWGYLVQFLSFPMSILRLLTALTTGLQLVAIKDYITEYKKMNEQLSNNFSVENNENMGLELDDEESKDITLSKEESKVEQLKQLRTLYLGMQQPEKTYTGKKRERIKLQEKNNILR